MRSMSVTGFSPAPAARKIVASTGGSVGDAVRCGKAAAPGANAIAGPETRATIEVAIATRIRRVGLVQSLWIDRIRLDAKGISARRGMPRCPEIAAS